MKRLLTSAALALVFLSSAWAEGPADPAGPPAMISADSLVPAATKTGKPKKAKTLEDPWSFRLSFSGLEDTNIEQDTTNVRSRGYVSSFRTRYRNQVPAGTVTLDYEIAQHSYTHSSTWDRTSHTASGSFERRIGRRWNWQSIGEVALKGSSDDREIRDEYSAVQRMEFILSKPHRIRLDAAWRKRKYDDEPAKDSQDPYYGVNFETLWRKEGTWVVGYRRDRNGASGAKYTYVRATYNSEITAPLGSRDRLLLETKYRILRYPERFIRVAGVSVPRRDHRWVVDASWEHDVDRTLKMSLGYRLETRRSNDLKREFDDSTYGTTITYRW